MKDAMHWTHESPVVEARWTDGDRVHSLTVDNTGSAYSPDLPASLITFRTDDDRIAAVLRVGLESAAAPVDLHCRQPIVIRSPL